MADPNPPSEPRSPRVIRVFVSSTFRDMQAERDVLVKRIFPQLRKLDRFPIWRDQPPVPLDAPWPQA